eukprot:NODE_731_length_1389_cov_373.130435.p1 GENE.NODE_731_length_1389_cov_373.130435~~NODE_731_length_1389_cov_373.130435.p1  ORF type:complete len:356 (+),score=105.26 NODE_731_length_1389_cov_373.130435:3-1070(+)
MGNPGERDPTAFVHAERAFTILFCAELLLRLYCERRYFAMQGNPNCKWNAFDLLVVVASCSGEIMRLAGTRSRASFSTNTLRIIKVCRILRCFRFFRTLRFFTELRMMVAGIQCSLVPLVWCLSLLGFCMFIVATVLLQILSDNDITHDVEKMAFMKEHFGSLPLAMYTLYTCITGGTDWSEINRGLFSINHLLGWTFCLYITFAILCLLNVVTGLYVHRATELMQREAAYMESLEHRAHHEMLAQIAEIFKTANASGDGYLTPDELLQHICDERVQIIFRLLGVDIDEHNALSIFKLMDLEGQGVLNMSDFLVGLMNFGGPARQITLCRVEQRLRRAGNRDSATRASNWKFGTV